MGLGAFRNALENTDEVEITVTGRTSGRTISLPVWFVRDGDLLYLVPVRGSDTDWFKNVRKTPTMRLAAGGASHTVHGSPVTDRKAVNDVVTMLRARYGAGQVRAYYSKLDVAVEISLR